MGPREGIKDLTNSVGQRAAISYAACISGINTRRFGSGDSCVYLLVCFEGWYRVGQHDYFYPHGYLSHSWLDRLTDLEPWLLSTVLTGGISPAARSVLNLWLRSFPGLL